MKFVVIYCLSFLFLGSIYGQKLTLDTGVLYHWPSVGDGFLSGDGRYVGYMINEEPRGSQTVILKGLSSPWERHWVNNSGKVAFSRDSRRAIFQNGDTLRIAELGTDKGETIDRVSSFQLFDREGKEYVSYLGRDRSRSLVLRALETGREDTLPGVESWLVAAGGRRLLVKQEGENGRLRIAWVELPGKKEQVLWEGKSGVVDWVTDETGEKAVFTVQGEGGKEVWYFREGVSQAARLLADGTAGLDKELGIGRLEGFTHDGQRVLLKLREKAPPKADPEVVSVDVWSYRDAKLQSQQLEERRTSPQKEYLAVLGLDSGSRIMRLQRAGEKLSFESEDKSYVVFDSTQGDRSEVNWSSAAQSRYELVDVQTGKRIAINKYISGFSPGGRFLMLSDHGTGDISSLELKTGQVRALTQGLVLPQGEEEVNTGQSMEYRGIGILGWLSGDEGVLMDDWYDIWELDPLARRRPLNLTGGYGARHRMGFRPALRYKGGLIGEDSLVLCAFDKETKANGFYRVALHQQQEPVRLTMGPYVWYAPHWLLGQPVVKAAGAGVYLVRRESAEESPNYYVTTDFRKFEPVSGIYPERSYRWLRSRLLNFTGEDGKRGQGVLYLPEDADSTHRYPVLLHYYEGKSHEVHKYHEPEGPNGDLNIVWFVNHGYAVFTPDIYATIGRTGESVLSAVGGAVRMLKGLREVDGSRLGLQGHSYGGWETDYLVTHRQGFAAAVASSGITDLASYYGDLWGGGQSKIGYMEMSQGRMGGPPSEYPDRYIGNSPIFVADRMNTPLLLVSNKHDLNVSFSQGVEFFTALRRLGKSVWMLQYDGGIHGLYGKDRSDYLLRTTQFFDHYLKGAAAPRWMTRGIPAVRKGLDLGYGLDTEQSEPGRGLLITRP